MKNEHLAGIKSVLARVNSVQIQVADMCEKHKEVDELSRAYGSISSRVEVSLVTMNEKLAALSQRLDSLQDRIDIIEN